MIIALYIAAAAIMGAWSLYFAWRNKDFRKFLAGAFFVPSGILSYLYLTDISVPLLGTCFVETPQISGGRSIVHFILFLLCLYFGFVRNAIPCTQAVPVFSLGLPLLLGSWADPAFSQLFILGIAWPAGAEGIRVAGGTNRCERALPLHSVRLSFPAP